jgi:hypothetical protein
METFVELLMLKKEDHLYFSLSVILFEILANDCSLTHTDLSGGKNEYVTPACNSGSGTYFTGKYRVIVILFVRITWSCASIIFVICICPPGP